MDDKTKYRLVPAACLIIFTALTRLLPHPPNFTPITAIALFGAATISSRWLAFVLPLSALLLSDLMLEFSTRAGILSGWLAQGYGFHRGMLVIYGIFALIVCIGLRLRKRRTLSAIALATLGSSLLFYVVANFGVWAIDNMYPHSIAGLLQCYLAAIPFFKWNILGNILYVALLFGGLHAFERFAPALVLDRRALVSS